MMNIVHYLQAKHASGECIQRYHRHKEWVFFVSLLAIILFLTCWSGWVDFKLTDLEHHVKKHEEFSIQILESQMIILEELKTTNPILHEKALNKLAALNKLIQEHVDDEARHQK